jgi:hypothetical protein
MDNPLYFSEPFSRTQAWIDLLLLANHKENYFFKRGIKVEVSIGQVGYDIESLGKRWQWSRGKVERFILHLEKEGNVVRQKNNVSTLISITKYKEYQADSKPKDNTKGKPNGHQIGTQTDTNKNDNNEKNEKEITPSVFDLVFESYLQMRKKIKKPATDNAIELIKKDLEKFAPNNPERQILILEQSIKNSWQGVFDLKVDAQVENEPHWKAYGKIHNSKQQ